MIPENSTPETPEPVPSTAKGPYQKLLAAWRQKRGVRLTADDVFTLVELDSMIHQALVANEDQWQPNDKGEP